MTAFIVIYVLGLIVLFSAYEIYRRSMELRTIWPQLMLDPFVVRLGICLWPGMMISYITVAIFGLITICVLAASTGLFVKAAHWLDKKFAKRRVEKSIAWLQEVVDAKPTPPPEKPYVKRTNRRRRRS
jgi:hypothetical protein